MKRTLEINTAARKLSDPLRKKNTTQFSSKFDEFEKIGEVFKLIFNLSDIEF